jgi:hypothetical protein
MQERNDQLGSPDEIDITTNAVFSHVYCEGILIILSTLVCRIAKKFKILFAI